MWELDYKESWAPKNWCFWTVVLEKTLESPLDYKDIQQVHPKGNQSWVFIGRTDVEAETPILWTPNVKSWLIQKDPDAGKEQRQEEKGTTEDEMVGWHHRLNGHGFGWTLGVGDGQGGLACCSPWNRKQTQLSDWIELNWTEWTEEPGGLQSMGSQRVGAQVGRIGKSTFIPPSRKLKSLICHFEKWTKSMCWVKAESIISMGLMKVTGLIIIWVYCSWWSSR